MSKSVRRAKVGEIFEGGTSLHLVIWDRLSEKSHPSGLTLMKRLVEEFDLVMPMLRPLGRGPDDYSKDFRTKFDKSPPNILCDDIPSAPLLRRRNGYTTGHCELWIQVADVINSTLIDSLRESFNKKSNVFAAFLNHGNPIWTPLGDSDARARNGFDTEIRHDIGEDKYYSALLKLMWYRSSVVIVDWLSAQDGAIATIDPVTQKGVLHGLMAEILSNINPNDYGLSSSFNSVDPSSFGVSHMSAFAVNALMPVIHFHQMEQYLGNQKVTRLKLYPNKEEFLKLFHP